MNQTLFFLFFAHDHLPGQNKFTDMDLLSKTTKIGIDDIAAYIPKIYLPIEELAEARNIEYAKLNKGLGLESMSFTDSHEDSATMAANAVRKLIEQNKLDPRKIGRIYMGTESALDGSKPTATYVLEMLSQYFEPIYGKDCFLYCDVVDLTFACIGAVDALQNTMDWVRADDNRMGIVVGSDVAKYDLASTGEYTQGAGAIAMLIKSNPRLIAFNSAWGIACKSVHDFFKPRRKYTKEEIIQEVLNLAGLNKINPQDILSQLNGKLDGKGIINMTDSSVYLHKDTPVFDGPFSNECYQARIKESLQHFACQKGLKSKEVITKNWARLIFHLPYAYQARRMFSEIYLEEIRLKGKLGELIQEIGEKEPLENDFPSKRDYLKAKGKFLRAVTKTPAYKMFVNEKIEKGERASSLVGNLYTSSIFLSLMSTLEADFQENNNLSGQSFGFFAYGSGAKSKVFEGVVQEAWKEVVSRFNLLEHLSERTAIDYQTYEKLHRGLCKLSICPISDEFAIQSVHTEKDDQEGARNYVWKKSVIEEVKI